MASRDYEFEDEYDENADIDWSPSQQSPPPSSSSDGGDDDDSSETIEGSENEINDEIITRLENDIDAKRCCEGCFSRFDFSTKLDDAIAEVYDYVTAKYNADVADGLTDEMTETEYYVYKDIMRAELGEKEACRHCEL